MDKDFGELVYRNDHTHAGVFLLRLADSIASQKATVVAHIFEEHGTSLPGRFSVYAGGYIRMRNEGSGQQGDAGDDAPRHP